MALEILPDDVLTTVVELLEARDLAALAVQSTRLRRLAGAESVWQRHAVARWPKCSLRGGHASWQALYRARAALPPSFCLDIDRIHELAAAARDSSSQQAPHLFQRTMQALLSAGLCAARDKSLRKTADMETLADAVRFWAAERPHVVIGFVIGTNASLQEFDIWIGQFVNYHDCPWRRSAIEFFTGVLGGLPAWEAQGLLPRLEAETARLDHTFRCVEEEAGDLSMPQPAGLPPSHWWLRMSGVHVRRVC